MSLRDADVKILKISGLIACIVFFFGALLYFVPFSKKVDITLSGIESSIGDPYSINTKLHIKGTYHTFLFQNDTFEGQISIDGYEYTFDERMNSLYFKITDSGTILNYSKNDYSEGFPLKVTTLGLIHATKNFEKVVLLIMEKDFSNISCWDGDKGKFACFPVKTRDEAITIAKEYF
jgi:hypothetical protein